MRKAPALNVEDDAYRRTVLLVGPLQSDDPIPDATAWARVRADVWRTWAREARAGVDRRASAHLLAVPFGAKLYDGVRCRPIESFPLSRDMLATFVAEDRPTIAAVPAKSRAMLERLLDFAERCPSGWSMKTLLRTAGDAGLVHHVWSENLRRIATGELTWDGTGWVRGIE